MTRSHAIDLAERLWGPAAMVMRQHQRRPRCLVGTLEHGSLNVKGSGSTWEGAFSAALSKEGT